MIASKIDPKNIQPLSMDEIKAIELDILLAIDRVCRENNICYFLDSGTLLGAVRHKGFIPWDDDIDIAMPQKDYERFIELAPAALGDDYFLSCAQTEPNCPYLFAKVRRRGTIFIEWYHRNNDMEQGIYVDIFPLYNVADDDAQWNEQHRRYKRAARAFELRATPDRCLLPQRSLKWLCGAAARRALHYLSCVRSLNSYRTEAEHYATMYSDQPTELLIPIFTLMRPCVKSNLYKRTELFPACEIEFEGHLFPAPHDYDAVLTKFFGNYMQLPPENERVGHEAAYLRGRLTQTDA